MRIFIAEDDKALLKFMESLLSEWGYEVDTAGNGLEALERLTAPDAPGIAILDWMMPGLEGIEVCRKVRLIETTVPPYIILLTARDKKRDIVEGL